MDPSSVPSPLQQFHLVGQVAGRITGRVVGINGITCEERFFLFRRMDGWR